MDSAGNPIFFILRAALGFSPRPERYELDEAQWESLFALAEREKLLSLLFDEVTSNPSNIPFRTKAKWSVRAVRLKSFNARKTGALLHLRDVLAGEGIPVMLLKGNGVARFFPKPELRDSTDIDIYAPGNFEKVNAVAVSLGLNPEEGMEKHTSFDFEGVHVENHRTIIEENTRAEKTVSRILSDNFDRFSDTDASLPGLLLPCRDIFAIYILVHSICHLEWMAWTCDGVKLSNLVDVAVSFNHYKDIMNWTVFDDFCERTKLGYAVSVFAEISERYFNCKWLSDSRKMKVREKDVELVMNEILNPAESPLDARGMLDMMSRTLKLRCTHIRKYRMIYRKPLFICVLNEVAGSLEHTVKFMKKRLCRSSR